MIQDPVVADGMNKAEKIVFSTLCRLLCYGARQYYLASISCPR
jgi:hypothetical protein